MSPQKVERNIQTRRQLFDFLQRQMQATYTDLIGNQKLSYESNLIKSYVLEVNNPEAFYGKKEEWSNNLKGNESLSRFRVTFIPTEEEDFFQLEINASNRVLHLYIDAATDPRFWLAYSISESQTLDRWLESLVRSNINFDFIWLWPRFLEKIQSRGYFRGFGLDYDYRKFETSDTELTTYLKMQLWGGENTRKIYNILQNDEDFKDKVVLSKVRFKQMGNNKNDPGAFAIQDVKFNGKFTARGTDFDTHLLTLNEVRDQYRDQIIYIENNCSLKWVKTNNSGASLEGYAIHFLPYNLNNFSIPVRLLVDKLFDGTAPFRLIGFPNDVNDNYASVEVVDLHTGGKLSIEIYPDLITIYLPEHTCGNTIARLYTNIQHSFNVGFRVETDDGIKLFD